MPTDLMTNVPIWFWAALCASVALTAAATRGARRTIRDPRRAFNETERMAGFLRAGAQCEFARWVFFRCTRTASHGDHFIPWSKGGATSMRNFVAACATCNMTKGAVMPSRLSRTLMAARRCRYFPSGIPRDAGEWWVTG